jgi:hypothetical protein
MGLPFWLPVPTSLEKICSFLVGHDTGCCVRNLLTSLQSAQVRKIVDDFIRSTVPAATIRSVG